LSKYTVIGWAHFSEQDCTEGRRGWLNGKGRKWSVLIESRIRAIQQYLKTTPDFFDGTFAIAYQWRVIYSNAPPPIRVIDQLLKDLNFSKPR